MEKFESFKSFIIKNENLFLDYTRFKQEKVNESKKYSAYIARQEEIIEENKDYFNGTDEDIKKKIQEISDKKAEIQRYNRKISKLGKDKKNKKISLSEKEMKEVEYNIEIENLKEQIKQLGKELEEMKKGREKKSNFVKAQDDLNKIMQSLEIVKQEITDKENDLENLVSAQIELGKEKLYRLTKARQDEKERVTEEMSELKIAIHGITLKKVEGKKQIEFKEKKLNELNKRLEKAESRLKTLDEDFDKDYNTIEKDVKEYQNLKENIKNINVIEEIISSKLEKTVEVFGETWKGDGKTGYFEREPEETSEEKINKDNKITLRKIFNLIKEKLTKKNKKKKVKNKKNIIELLKEKLTKSKNNKKEIEDRKIEEDFNNIQEELPDYAIGKSSKEERNDFIDSLQVRPLQDTTHEIENFKELNTEELSEESQDFISVFTKTNEEHPEDDEIDFMMATIDVEDTVGRLIEEIKEDDDREAI